MIRTCFGNPANVWFQGPRRSCDEDRLEVRIITRRRFGITCVFSHSFRCPITLQGRGYIHNRILTSSTNPQPTFSVTDHVNLNAIWCSLLHTTRIGTTTKACVIIRSKIFLEIHGNHQKKSLHSMEVYCRDSTSRVNKSRKLFQNRPNIPDLIPRTRLVADIRLKSNHECSVVRPTYDGERTSK